MRYRWNTDRLFGSVCYLRWTIICWKHETIVASEFQEVWISRCWRKALGGKEPIRCVNSFRCRSAQSPRDTNTELNWTTILQAQTGARWPAVVPTLHCISKRSATGEGGMQQVLPDQTKTHNREWQSCQQLQCTFQKTWPPSALDLFDTWTGNYRQNSDGNKAENGKVSQTLQHFIKG